VREQRNEIGLRAAGCKNRSFLACHFCCQRFKPINRRVIAKHIITNGGFVHRLAHGRGGLGHGVTTKVNHRF
jgi:hypothetical protein